jgi:hypothetical protein
MDRARTDPTSIGKEFPDAAIAVVFMTNPLLLPYRYRAVLLLVRSPEWGTADCIEGGAGHGGSARAQAAIEVPNAGRGARGPARPRCRRGVGRDQSIFNSSWQASLKVRNGSGNPWPIDCLIPENVVFSLA